MFLNRWLKKQKQNPHNHTSPTSAIFLGFVLGLCQENLCTQVGQILLPTSTYLLQFYPPPPRPLFLVTQTCFVHSSGSQLTKPISQPPAQPRMAKSLSSGQGHISRRHHLGLPGKLFKGSRFDWFVPLASCLSSSLFLGRSWRSSSHTVIMRQQAWGWKLDSQKEGQTGQRDPQIWWCWKARATCLRLPYLDYRGKKKVFWLSHCGFSFLLHTAEIIADSCIRYWWMSPWTRKRKSQLYIFNCILQFFYGSMFSPTTDWMLIYLD